MRFKRNSINDLGIEKVDTSIDFIRNEFFRFLNKSINLSCTIGDYNSIFCWILHLCEQNCTFFSMFFMKIKHVLKREITNDIAIQDKKQSFSIVFSEMLLCKLKRSTCSKRLKFLRTYDIYLILFLELFDLFEHRFWLESNS